LFAIRAGASGDLTLKEGATSSADVVWYRTQAGPAIASPLLYRGYLYVADERGMLSCYDARTGKPAYTKQRLRGARGFMASPWAYDGKLFWLDQEGQTFVVKAGSQFKLLGTNKIDEMFYASPALADGSVFLRGVDHLYAVAKKGGGS
jgi:outer membrane protein assembly factor BamB